MECKYCNKKINNKGSLVSHEMCCRENPNKIKHARGTGHLGKKHSPESKQKIASSLKGHTISNNTREKLKNVMLGKKHTEKTKKKMSISRKKMYENGWQCVCGRCKKFKYIDKHENEILVDGSWEYNVAIYLDKHNINWIRNKQRFRYINLKHKASTYCPDFHLIDTDEYLEVKGYETDLDRCKWKQFPKKLIIWKKQNLIDLGIPLTTRKVN